MCNMINAAASKLTLITIIVKFSQQKRIITYLKARNGVTWENKSLKENCNASLFLQKLFFCWKSAANFYSQQSRSSNLWCHDKLLSLCAAKRKERLNWWVFYTHTSLDLWQWQKFGLWRWNQIPKKSMFGEFALHFTAKHNSPLTTFREIKAQF